MRWLRANDSFPPVEQALQSPNGLLAAGADLGTQRLLDAYKHGIFPWFSEGQPVLWWSPDPRLVLFLDELKVSRSLRKTLARQPFQVRADSAFRQVMLACAEPRTEEGGTWITPEMLDAYCELHRLGYAQELARRLGWHRRSRTRRWYVATPSTSLRPCSFRVRRLV